LSSTDLLVHAVQHKTPYCLLSTWSCIQSKIRLSKFKNPLMTCIWVEFVIQILILCFSLMWLACQWQGSYTKIHTNFTCGWFAAMEYPNDKSCNESSIFWKNEKLNRHIGDYMFAIYQPRPKTISHPVHYLIWESFTCTCAKKILPQNIVLDFSLTAAVNCYRYDTWYDTWLTDLSCTYNH
jgi:hypothetical protein